MGLKIKDIQANSSNQKSRRVSNNRSPFSWLNKDLELFSSINDKVKFRFYSELNLLLESGIDLRSSLELVIESEKKEKLKQFFEDILEKVVEGKSFSAVLQESDKFSDYEFFSVRIGEETGKLREVLADLADFYEGRIEFKRTLMSTFSYPVIVILTAFGAVGFMLNFIVPIFEDAFQRFGGDLPALTQMIISMSDFLQEYALIAFLVLATVGLLLYVQRKKVWFRSFSTKLVLGLPVIGGIVQKSVLARFCHSMALLTSVNNPLVNSLALVRRMVQFYPMEIALDATEKDIVNGELFHTALKKHNIFPKRMVSLIRVAEEVNKLEDVFKRLNKQYTNETENSTKTISSLLEPILIIFIGSFVGVILVAMYLPLFDIGNIMQ